MPQRIATAVTHTSGTTTSEHKQQLAADAVPTQHPGPAAEASGSSPATPKSKRQGQPQQAEPRAYMKHKATSVRAPSKLASSKAGAPSPNDPQGSLLGKDSPNGTVLASAPPALRLQGSTNVDTPQTLSASPLPGKGILKATLPGHWSKQKRARRAQAFDSAPAALQVSNGLSTPAAAAGGGTPGSSSGKRVQWSLSRNTVRRF